MTIVSQRRTCAIALLVFLTVSATAQTRLGTIAGFSRSMAAAADAFELIEQAVSSNVYLLNSVRGDAITQLETVRKSLAAMRGFFADRKKDDGVAFVDETLAAMGPLRDELTAAEPNQAIAAEAAEHVSQACAACHKVYRDGDLRTGYRFKVGTLE